MTKKVKLPRNVIDTFRTALDSPHYRLLGSLTPIGIISDMYNHTLKDVTNDVANWLNDYDNQWKLIDALRYGYEAEPEPIYYVRFIQNNSHSFLNSSESDGLEISDNEETEYIKTKLTMPEILAIDPRYKAFAVPVEEVDGND